MEASQVLLAAHSFLSMVITLQKLSQPFSAIMTTPATSTPSVPEGQTSSLSPASITSTFTIHGGVKTTAASDCPSYLLVHTIDEPAPGPTPHHITEEARDVPPEGKWLLQCLKHHISVDMILVEPRQKPSANSGKDKSIGELLHSHEPNWRRTLNKLANDSGNHAYHLSSRNPSLFPDDLDCLNYFNTFRRHLPNTLDGYLAENGYPSVKVSNVQDEEEWANFVKVGEGAMME
jgi:hypothetical protein